MEKREQLEQQLKDLEAQKVTLFDSGSADPVEVGRINEKIKATQQQLNAIERDEVIEEKIHADEIPFAVSGVDMVGMPVEVIQFVEEVVKTDRKRIYNEHAIELEQMEQANDQLAADLGKTTMEVKDMADQVKELSDSHSELVSSMELINKNHENTVNDLKSQLAQAVFEKEEAESKRDAAVKEHEQTRQSLQLSLGIAEKERDYFRKKVEEYEQANAYAERQEQPLTTTPEESTSLQEKADAIKKLFVSRENWGSVDKLTLPDGSYKVVKRSEVEDNWEEATVPEIAQEATEEVEAPEIAQFQEEDETTAVQEHTVHGEVDDQSTPDRTVTRAEFEELKMFVGKLELNQDGSVTWNRMEAVA